MSILITATIMIYFILLIILVLNLEEKSKIIKYSFLLFIFILLVAVFMVNELVMDYLITIVLRYIYFPTFSSIIATLLVSMVLFIYNLNKESLSDKYRIMNYVFAFLIFIGYVIFMILDVNINSFNALYSGSSLKCLRYLSRTFILWMIFIFAIKYYHYFIRRK